MLELLRKRVNILGRKQRHEVCGFRRVTADKLNRLISFENPRHLVTRHENRNATRRTPHPFRELALGVRVRAIHFI